MPYKEADRSVLSSHIIEQASQMEAEHCNQMEKTKEELQIRWQTMYKEWMRTTEQKIVELQTANDIMRQTLEGHRPQQ